MKKRNRKTVAAVIIILVIVSVIGNSFLLIPLFTPLSFETVGELHYSETELQSNNIFLDIFNNIGNIEIEYIETLDTLFEITVIVKARKEIDQSKFAEFNITENRDRTDITFDSGTQKFSFFNRDILYYDITIRLAPSIILNAEINANVASIDYNINSYNAFVKNMDISTNTGDITIYSALNSNITIENTVLDTSTGSISLDFSSLKQSYLGEISANTNTGSIHLNFGENCTIGVNEIILDTSTGNIAVEYKNMIYSQNCTWRIDTNTGNVFIEVKQETIVNRSLYTIFLVSLSTGSIDIDATFDESIGYAIIADTDTGTISVPQYSHNYGESLNNYYFELVTSTGDIRITI